VTIVHLLTGIEGRISRQPFWLASLVLLAIEIAAQYLFDKAGVAVVGLLLAYPEFAVLAKRGHDRNVPTWIAGLFVMLNTIAGVLDYFDLFDTASEPGMLFYVLAIPLGIFALILLIDFGFRRGTVGANRYGPDPLAADATI
jgi:uncharacterized membrane protein YhaH (DUF805 family)